MSACDLSRSKASRGRSTSIRTRRKRRAELIVCLITKMNSVMKLSLGKWVYEAHVTDKSTAAVTIAYF